MTLSFFYVVLGELIQVKAEVFTSRHRHALRWHCLWTETPTNAQGGQDGKLSSLQRLPDVSPEYVPNFAAAGVCCCSRRGDDSEGKPQLGPSLPRVV